MAGNMTLEERLGWPMVWGAGDISDLDCAQVDRRRKGLGEYNSSSGRGKAEIDQMGVGKL